MNSNVVCQTDEEQCNYFPEPHSYVNTVTYIVILRVNPGLPGVKGLHCITNRLLN